jgi:hypothetical protein
MLDLLNRRDLQLEYNIPFEEGSSEPALWLSAVGKNDLWPIRILNRDEVTINRRFVPAISEAAAIYSRPLVFVSALLALLCLFAAVALIMELAAKDGSISRLTNRFAGCFKLRREVLLHKYIRPKLNWYLKICGEAVFADQSAYRRAFILSLAVSSSIISLVLFSVFLRFFLYSAKPWSMLSLWNRWTSFLILALFATGATLTAMLLVGRKVFPVKSQDLRTFHRVNPKRLYVLLAFMGGALACAAVRFFLPSMISHHAASLLLIAALFFALLICFLSTRQPAASVTATESHDQGQRLRRIQTDLSCFVVAAVPILIFCVAAFQVFDIINMNEATKLFYHLRTVNLTSGLSPLLPLFFVALAAVLWTVCSLRRLRMLEELIGPNEASAPQLLYLGQESAKTLNAFERRIKELLTGEFFHLPGSPLILLFIGVPCFILFLVRLVPSIESSGFYLFFGISFFAVYLALTFTFLRFLCVWRETHLLLNYLSSHSLSAAYGEFAKASDSMPKLDMSDAFAPYRALNFVAQYADRCVITANERDVRRLLNLSAMADARGHWERAIKLRHCAQRSLATAAAEVGAALQSPRAYGKEWIQDARHFLAARSVLFLHHVLSHLQNLLLFVVAGLILMLLAITYYPFQPREWLLWFNWVVIIATVSLTAAVFVQMGRNRVLSILANTTPGQVTWNREFFFRVLLYVIVPLLTLLGAQFPESMRSVLSWLGAFQTS